jgi:uncharacterized membrane protein YedE/YeeE
MSNVDVTPLSSLAGGVLIGLGASVYLLVNGRVAGVSGILGGIVEGFRKDGRLGGIFVAALLSAGAMTAWLAPGAVDEPRAGAPWIAVAGLLVGIGTRVSGGCTSGHGLCGLSRGSLRSLVATVTFVGTGMMTVAMLRVLGARP